MSRSTRVSPNTSHIHQDICVLIQMLGTVELSMEQTDTSCDILERATSCRIALAILHAYVIVLSHLRRRTLGVIVLIVHPCLLQKDRP